ncbi:MAG: outer membrane beta-barrel protein [Bacteroidales bacterium]|nr:outer membrane beta-barrel protein [Bacteroidales bacterium]
MVSKRSSLLLAIIFLVSYPLFCQKIFREGYIIKNNGDILNGLIEFKSKQDIPSACTFKRFDIAVEIAYYPGEIKEFGYVNGNRYISKKLAGKDNFIEVMVSGKINLYRKGSRYFLEKSPADMVELTEGSIVYSADGEQNKFSGLTSFLEYVTEGKAVKIKEKLNPKKDLLPLITGYNKNSGTPYIVYNHEFSQKTLISESFRSGGSRNSFGIYSGINMYSLQIKPESDFFIPDPDPEISSIAGLTYERIISRMNDKLSVRTDLMFLKQNFYSYREYSIQTQILRDDAFFDFTGIKIPVMLQYSFPSGRIIPYLNIGASYMLLIRKNYLHIRETETYNHDIYTSEDSDMTFHFGEPAVVVGTGVKIRITGNLKLNIQGRFEMGKGLFNSATALFNYSQFSIQPTFMVGIAY